MPQTNNPWLILIGLVFTFLSGAGGLEMVRGFLKKRPKRTIEITNQIQLAEQIQKYSEQLEQDAAQARESAQRAWAAVDEAQQKLVRANRKLDHSIWQLELTTRYLDTVVAKIYAHGSSIEEVKRYIETTPPPQFNRNGAGPQD